MYHVVMVLNCRHPILLGYEMNRNIYAAVSLVTWNNGYAKKQYLNVTNKTTTPSEITRM